MPYNNQYKTELIQINKLIDDNKILGQNEALDKFKQHIVGVVNIGRFTIADWNKQWRKEVYKFGTKFETINPIDFLNALTTAKIGKTKDQQEVLDFYYSEIEFNSLPDETCTQKLQQLVSLYPYNPEFRHSFGHFYDRINDYKNSISQYEYALKKDKTNTDFLTSLFTTYQKYLETFIDDSKYKEGLKLCEDIMEKKTFWDDANYHNYLFSLKERFKDYVLLNEKIEQAEVKIQEITARETQKGQIKIIEILGFFTAIIAFIFSTVSIGKNFKFEEAIVFNISLGITLMTFVLMLNIFFSRKEMKIWDIKVLLLIILVLLLTLIVTKFGIPFWIE